MNGDEGRIVRVKIVSILLITAMVFAALPGLSGTAKAADTYNIQGVTLPLAKHPDGGRSYGRNQCWAFAAKVYKTLWGQTITSYRGTNDDMLRDVETGKARAITAENTKKFIEQAPLGSNIRIADRINGSDLNGKRKHSQILIQKDEDGFSVYESVNSGVRIRTYTWAQYAAKYTNYKYFKYIKYPVPVIEPTAMEILKEKQIAALDNGSRSAAGVKDFAQWSEWLFSNKTLPAVLIQPIV